MRRIEKGIGELLEHLERKGVPIPSEFRGISGFDGTFRHFLESTPIRQTSIIIPDPLRLKGGTRRRKGGQNKRELLIKVLLFLVNHFVFDQVFQMGKESIPTNARDIMYLVKNQKLEITTTDGYVVILAGLMVSMMVNLGTIMKQFENRIPQSSNRIEVIVNSMNSNNRNGTRSKQRGGARNLLELFEEQQKTVLSIPLQDTHLSLLHVLESLQTPTHQDLIRMIESSVGPMEAILAELRKPVGGTVGSLFGKGFAEIQMGGNFTEDVLKPGFAWILFFVLFVYGGGSRLGVLALNASGRNIRNRETGLNIRRSYNIPWIGTVLASDSDKYVFYTVGALFFYGGLSAWIYSKIRKEEVQPQQPALSEYIPDELQRFMEEYTHRNPNEFNEEEREIFFNRLYAIPNLPEHAREGAVESAHGNIMNRVNEINNNFQRGNITRKRVPRNTEAQISFEPVKTGMQMVNVNGELNRYGRAYNWPTFKEYIQTKEGLITHPTTRKRLRRKNLVPYIAIVESNINNNFGNTMRSMFGTFEEGPSKVENIKPNNAKKKD